ncbi:EH signature domain-containing protein [Celeribacter arenosi]|uniref:EH signature domain-containing protein n=1 Tax=Celeribacter arenosi TaxID=792649 RepID=A0ABP7KFZ3_9RHOB
MSLADRLVLSPEFKVRTGRAVALDVAVDRIEQAFPGVEKRAPEDVPVILKKVEAALQSGDWSGVSAGDVSVAVFAEIGGHSVISKRLQEFISQELSVTTNRTLLDAVARGYLVSWAENSEKTKSLSNMLIQKAALLPERWKNLFNECPEFLDAERGSFRVGERMVDAHAPFEWLKRIGMPSPHDDGFMRFAHQEFLRQTPDPRSERIVDKLVSWVTPTGKQKEFGSREAEVVEKILAPWMNSDCPESLREHCVDKLVNRFGDPRTEHPAFWSQIGIPHRRVMLKWLARKSMEAMFEIVTQAEKGTEHGHQWVKRKRFWMGVYDKGQIDEAWVALGKKAIPYAKDLYSQTSDPSFLSFGRQARRDTCLLLMKINDKTIVEGSHNFRVHVFPTPTRVTPELYADAYDLDDIMLPKQHPDARVHDSGGNWMSWIQRRIST